MRIRERKNSADTKISEGGGGGAPGRDYPAAHGEETMVTQVVLRGRPQRGKMRAMGRSTRRDGGELILFSMSHQAVS